MSRFALPAGFSTHSHVSRCLIATAFVLLPAGVLSSGPSGLTDPPEPETVQIRFIRPQARFLSGIEEILLEVDLPAGDRVDRLDLFIDGERAYRTDRSPYRFHHDFGTSGRAHRLLALLFTRAGRTARAEFRSRPNLPASHVDVKLVQLNVVVQDADGRFVTSLEREDFTILEEGVEQRIAVFEKGNTPCSVVLALDSSLSMKHRLWRAQKAAGDFLQDLPGHYEISILGFNDTVFLVQDFTFEKRPLIYAIHRLQPEGNTALYDAIRAASIHLRDRPSRKAVVLYTDGEESVRDRDGDGERVLGEVLDVANQAEVTFFAIGYGGQSSRETLSRIADETGGRIFETDSRTDLGSFYREITRDLESQYTLAYYPSPDPPAGSWRSLEVRVGREGLTPRTRKGYRSSPP